MKRDQDNWNAVVDKIHELLDAVDTKLHLMSREEYYQIQDKIAEVINDWKKQKEAR